MRYILVLFCLSFQGSLLGQNFVLYGTNILLYGKAVEVGVSVKFTIQIKNLDSSAICIAASGDERDSVQYELVARDSSLSVRVGVTSSIVGIPYHSTFYSKIVLPGDSVTFYTTGVERQAWRSIKVAFDFIALKKLRIARGFDPFSMVEPTFLRMTDYVTHAEFIRTHFFY